MAPQQNLDLCQDGDGMVGRESHHDLFVFGANTGSDTVTDFDLVDNMLVLEDGIAAAGTSEADINGDGALDTILALSDDGGVTLPGVDGVIDPDALFV